MFCDEHETLSSWRYAEDCDHCTIVNLLDATENEVTLEISIGHEDSCRQGHLKHLEAGPGGRPYH